MNLNHMMSYAHGVLDGYMVHSDNNPYKEDNTEAYEAYKLGFEYGYGMYCADNAEEAV